MRMMTKNSEGDRLPNLINQQARLTKPLPLQGMAFRVMRAKLMNSDKDYKDDETNNHKRIKPSRVNGRTVSLGPTQQSLQECVGVGDCATRGQSTGSYSVATIKAQQTTDKK